MSCAAVIITGGLRDDLEASERSTEGAMLDEDDVCDEADDDYDDGGSASVLVADDEDFKASVKTLHVTVRNTLNCTLLFRDAISPPLPKTLGSSEVQPQSPVGAAILQTETERAYGQVHLREGRASKIGGEVELLIARWSPVLQDEETQEGPFVPHKIWSPSSRCADEVYGE
jgi:hypothetical protein